MPPGWGDRLDMRKTLAGVDRAARSVRCVQRARGVWVFVGVYGGNLLPPCRQRGCNTVDRARKKCERAEVAKTVAVIDFGLVGDCA